MTQTRFQPRQGRLLAAAAENVVSILDVESETCIHSLQVCEVPPEKELCCAQDYWVLKLSWYNVHTNWTACLAACLCSKLVGGPWPQGCGK
jgi:hypothetical protein